MLLYVVILRLKSKHVSTICTHSFILYFLPPSLWSGLEGTPCALLHTVQSAPRPSPSCDSRRPVQRPERLTLAAQSPGERSSRLGAERCSGVGSSKCPLVRNRRRRAEGTPARPPGPTRVRGPHRSRTRRPRCRRGRGRSRRHHRL